MPEFICTNDCFIRHESPTGRPIHYLRNEVKTFKEKPRRHFVPTSSVTITSEPVPQQTFTGPPPVEKKDQFSFATASEDILMAVDFKPEDLVAFAKEQYKITLKAGDSKEKLVAKFVDARYRFTEQQKQVSAIIGTTPTATALGTPDTTKDTQDSQVPQGAGAGKSK